jgi:hypothetical protein
VSVDTVNGGNYNSLLTMSFMVSAQKILDISSNFDNILDTNNTMATQKNTTILKASGHFANNQIENGVVTWIEGGFWNLDIKNDKNVENASNMTADFNANFTMIKPDGSLSHSHVINNFESDDVIFAGKDIIVIGIADIHSDNGTEYSKVPITIHLMGKKVLGLMIDVTKTESHFVSSNEMFGTLISGIGLDNSSSIVKDMINNSATQNVNDSSMDNLMMTHIMH